MSVEVARTPIYPDYPNGGFDALDSSSGDTDEFIRSVKDSLQRGRYDTNNKANRRFGVVNSEDEQPSLSMDDEAEGNLRQGGGSLTELVELPTSDDEESKWLSPDSLQNKLLKVKQSSPGVEDLVLNYPNESVKHEGIIGDDRISQLPLDIGSNHCSMTKMLARRNTCGQLPNNCMAERLAEFLKKRSKSLTHLDTQDLLEVNSFDISEHTSNANHIECIPSSRKSSREVDDVPHRIPKKRCSSADSRRSAESRRSLGGESKYSLGESSHRYSEVSTTSDSDSLRRRYLGWSRRFSNYSVATSEQTTLSSFIEPETAVDLAENLMIELFDTDDIDGIIPARFLQANQDAIVDNIREEEYSPSFSPTASCGQSSFDEDFSLPYNLAGEVGSELRFSIVSSPHNTGSPRSSRHSKSSSPERTEPISSYPIEGVMPRNSMFSLTNTQLDTVEEETASQISPSPRVMSPRISIDNGENFDVLVDHHTKPSLPTTHRLSVPHGRKISLQRDHSREYHRFSVESIPVSENSFYFSVTSFDDDFVGKMEMIEDSVHSPKLDRRQRKMATVSSPNATVLQWLASMPKEKPGSVDPEEPWPFNEDVASSATGSEVTMETLAVPERKVSLSETSDLDSFHSCRDDYAASNISGQDSFDCYQLDANQNEQITDQQNQEDIDKEDTLRRGMDQQPSYRRQRLKPQREAVDFDD